MTREELFAAIDADAAELLALWTPLQTAYLQSHGCYMQVLESHSEIPADGVATVPDRLDDAPPYQLESAADFFAAEPMLAAYAIDQHVGPAGCGWTMITSVRWQETLWQRRRGVGAHSETHDWRTVEEVAF